MRFFFKLTDGDTFEDNEGTELADRNAAEREAAKIAAEWLRDNPETFRQDGVLKVEIVDHKKTSVGTITINLHRNDNVAG